LQGFVPGMLSQLILGAGGTSSEDAGEQGQRIFDKIVDGVRRFGRGVVSGLENAVSFGAKVLERGAGFIKEGFAKAVDFFSNFFDRHTQEIMMSAGDGSIENAILSSNFLDCGNNIYQSTVCFGNEVVVLDLNMALNRLDYHCDRVSASAVGLNLAGDVFGGRFAFAEDITDGVILEHEYDDGQLSVAKMLNGLDILLEMNPFSERQSLVFSNGVLTDGVLSIYGDHPVEISIMNGIVDKYTALVSRNSYMGTDNIETFENVFVDLTKDSSGKYQGNVRIENPIVDNATGLAGVRERTARLADIFFGNGIDNPNEPGVSPEYANLFVEVFASRGLILQPVPLFEGTDEITGIYQVAKEMLFTNPVNKGKIKEAILNRIHQQPLAPGEKLNLVLYSGAGQSGLEAAQELGDEFGIEFDNIILLDAPVLINSALNNVNRVSLITGDRFNFGDGAPSIGIAVPQIVNAIGGLNLGSVLGFLKIKYKTISRYDHLDFIKKENVATIVDMILGLQRGDE